MIYTLYDKSTGCVTRVLFAPEVELLELNLMENEGYIEGEFPSDAYVIQNGTPVLLPPKPVGGLYRLCPDQHIWLDISGDDERRSAARAYLASTDWMVIRSMEGTPIPEEVIERRRQARIDASS